jgi:hypothetical protein
VPEISLPNKYWLAIRMEYERALKNYPPFNSAHEGLAIIEEEFEELKAEVFKNDSLRSRSALQEEAIQLGAMALCFLVDIVAAGDTHA